MRFLIGLLFWMKFVHAESLQLMDVQYHYPAQSASCGILKHRELERQKVIRELEHMRKLAKQGQYAAILQGNNLLVNKLFMPNETWRDLSVEVILTIKMTKAMIQEASTIGSGSLYLSVEAPGFIWQSYTNQIPHEMNVVLNINESLMSIRYLTYYNVLCLDQNFVPVVQWIPSQEAPSRPNTWELFRGM